MTPTRPASPAQVTGPNVSVVIAAYSSDRWTQLRDAVASVGAQHRPALETIVVVDHNPELLDRAKRELTDAVVVPNGGQRGASGARNTGVARSRGEVVAFLDDDASATPEWLARVLPGAVGRGLREAATGERPGALRSFAIIGGFGMAAVGFALGGLSASTSVSRRTTSPAATTATAELAVAL
jgi:glycosyltransferase involved in cell wall biosynthesis